MATVSRKQRAAANAWDKKNMRVVSTKIKKEDYDLFQRYCEVRNQTVSSMVAGFVRRCIQEDNPTSE